MLLPVGSPAPHFSLTAIASNRQINPASATGLLLLIFHSYQTVDEARLIIRAVRESYPSPDQILIASVADMRIVPRLARGMAKRIMQNAYEEAKKEIPEGHEPSDHIIILPDWYGKVFDAYNVPNTSGEVALVIIYESQIVQGSYKGHEPVMAVLELLAEIQSCSS